MITYSTISKGHTCLDHDYANYAKFLGCIISLDALSVVKTMDIAVLLFHHHYYYWYNQHSAQVKCCSLLVRAIFLVTAILVVLHTL